MFHFRKRPTPAVVKPIHAIDLTDAEAQTIRGHINIMAQSWEFAEKYKIRGDTKLSLTSLFSILDSMGLIVSRKGE